MLAILEKFTWWLLKNVIVSIYEGKNNFKKQKFFQELSFLLIVLNFFIDYVTKKDILTAYSRLQVYFLRFKESESFWVHGLNVSMLFENHLICLWIGDLESWNA